MMNARIGTKLGYWHSLLSFVHIYYVRICRDTGYEIYARL